MEDKKDNILLRISIAEAFAGYFIFVGAVLVLWFIAKCFGYDSPKKPKPALDTIPVETRMARRPRKPKSTVTYDTTHRQTQPYDTEPDI